MRVALAAAFGLLLLAQSAAAQSFTWVVPDETARVDVPGTIFANGLPVRLEARRSKRPVPELFAHFQKQFALHGFYIAPSRDLTRVSSEPMISAYDSLRSVSYTVIFQANPDGSTTCILGESHLRERLPPSVDGVPLFPGAKDVIRTTMEGATVVSYGATAPAADVQRFYRDVLGGAGWRDSGNGAFAKDSLGVRVRISGADGALAVSLFLRSSAKDSPSEVPK
jgi:hypothetical protein